MPSGSEISSSSRARDERRSLQAIAHAIRLRRDAKAHARRSSCSASAWNQSACGPGITRSSARPFVGSVRPADFRCGRGRGSSAIGTRSPAASARPLKPPMRLTRCVARLPSTGARLHAAGDGQIGASALHDAAELQALPARHGERRADRHRPIVAGHLELRAGDRHRRVGLDDQLRADQRDLERGRVGVVADQLVGEPMRKRVHRPGHRHAGRLMAVAAQVLHRRQQAGLDDVQRAGAHRLRCRHEPHEIAGGEQARLRRDRRRTSPSSVRPISCQPPGLSTGYTPVCTPAMPTEPAGTRSRGTRCRGAAIDGSTRPM